MNKILSFALFAVCFIFVVVVGFWTYRMFWHQQPVTEVKISYVMPADSIQNVHALEMMNATTDSLVNVIKKQEEELQQRYELFLKAREDDADIARMLSCLGAFILALLGIFGIKSYKDLSENVERIAEKKAKEIAETRANETANSKASEIAEQIASSIATEVARSTSTNTISDLVSTSVQRTINERLSNGTYTEEVIQQVYDKIMPEITNMIESSIHGDSNENHSDEQPAEDMDIVSIDSMPQISNVEPSSHE